MALGELRKFSKGVAGCGLSALCHCFWVRGFECIDWLSFMDETVYLKIMWQGLAITCIEWSAISTAIACNRNLRLPYPGASVEGISTWNISWHQVQRSLSTGITWDNWLVAGVHSSFYEMQKSESVKVLHCSPAQGTWAGFRPWDDRLAMASFTLPLVLLTSISRHRIHRYRGLDLSRVFVLKSHLDWRPLHKTSQITVLLCFTQILWFDICTKSYVIVVTSTPARFFYGWPSSIVYFFPRVVFFPDSWQAKGLIAGDFKRKSAFWLLAQCFLDFSHYELQTMLLMWL
jgi:hypothetical protein